jgi:hypothetical protein
MEVFSPLTGRRGVSLPFTDLCFSLGSAEAGALHKAALTEGQRRGWRYLECRSSDDGWPGASPSLSFWGHAIDLRGGVDQLLGGMNAAVRRGVRKAEKAGLKVEFRTDADAIAAYFDLHCNTRRRHGLPPQPFSFFDNVRRTMLSAGQGEVGLVWSGRQAIAGAVYLGLGRQIMYKYGASDYEAQEWRPNNLLMWGAMQRYAANGYERLHLGRTSIGHEGLRRFKLGFGAAESRISFCKFDFKTKQFVTEEDKVEGWFNRIFERMPLFVLRLAGKMLYPHLS